MHRTNVEIPEEIAQWIKAQGMTYRGAFLQGIKAMQERKTWNQELSDVMNNMNKFRDRMLKAEHRLRELGEKIE